MNLNQVILGSLSRQAKLWDDSATEAQTQKKKTFNNVKLIFFWKLSKTFFQSRKDIFSHKWSKKFSKKWKLVANKYLFWIYFPFIFWFFCRSSEFPGNCDDFIATDILFRKRFRFDSSRLLSFSERDKDVQTRKRETAAFWAKVMFHWCAVK